MLRNFVKKLGFDSTELVIDSSIHTLAFLWRFIHSVKFHCQFKECLLRPILVPDYSEKFPNESSIMHMYHHIER